MEIPELTNYFFAILYLTGLAILIAWLIKTKYGTAALLHSKPRRHNMPNILPFLLIFIWIALSSALVGLIRKTDLFSAFDQWQKTLLTYLSLAIVEILMICVILLAGWHYFARRLKGFGLAAKNLLPDAAWAAIALIAVAPLVELLVRAVVFIGKLFVGESFQMQQNEGIADILAYDNLSVKVAIFLFSVLIVPFFEETLFRGIIQSYLRGLLKKPWHAILLTSAIFTMLHPAMHWPALLVFSIALGYTYEKSSSLWRPIIMHSLFNGINLTITLINQ